MDNVPAHENNRKDVYWICKNVWKRIKRCRSCTKNKGNRDTSTIRRSVSMSESLWCYICGKSQTRDGTSHDCTPLTENDDNIDLSTPGPFITRWLDSTRQPRGSDVNFKQCRFLNSRERSPDLTCESMISSRYGTSRQRHITHDCGANQ